MCLSVREDISGTARAIFTNFLCVFPMSVARSSFGTVTIGRISYRREGGDGSAQRGRCVIYDCLVVVIAAAAAATAVVLTSGRPYVLRYVTVIARVFWKQRTVSYCTFPGVKNDRVLNDVAPNDS